MRISGVGKSRQVVLALGIVLALAGCSESDQPQAQQSAPPPPAVTVAKPVVRDVVEDDVFVGRFEAVDEVEIRSRVGGYLEEIHFSDGALVEKGQLLFTIDTRPFQLALDQSQSQMTVSQTQLDFAEAQIERAEALASRGTISVSTLDERRQEFLAAQASLEGAKAVAARASLDLEYSRITAPISGRIDRRQVSAGNLVQADQTVLTSIVSLDPIDFYFDVDERTYLSYAQDALTRGDALQEGSGGLDVLVSVDARESEPVAGKLDFAENRIDSASGTLRIRARFPNENLLLQPGLFGRVNVPGSLPYRGVLVPDEAVASDQGRRIVYVVDGDGLVSAQPVQPGPKLHGYRVIRNGLSGDETIVVNGLMRVRPGVTIDPQMSELPPSRDGEG